MTNKKPTLKAMFMAFFRIGLFTFGGGYAMLPMLQKEVVEKYQWATEEELLDYFAIAQGTPGIIAVNTATFIGTKYRGILGAIIATLGVVFPSWLIISGISIFLKNLQSLELVESAFTGIRIVVVALIISSILKMGKKAILKWYDLIISLVACLMILLLHLSPVMIIGLGLLGNFLVLLMRGGKPWRC